MSDRDLGNGLRATMMYYPWVHPPRPVLWKALLYWDELTSISPVYGYAFRDDLTRLKERGLYRPSYVDDLPLPARAELVRDLITVVEELPGEDLVPVPGPLTASNRLHWGSLPDDVQTELVDIGALVREDDDLLRGSPVLLPRLMVVLAKHMARAGQGVVPFTSSAPAYEMAFAPLGPDLSHRRCWQLQIGDLLPVPAPDTPLLQVLEFRDAYADERKELAAKVRKLLYSASWEAGDADPASVQAEIREAVRRLERAGSGRIVWVKRTLWVLAAMGAAAAGAYVAIPWFFTTLAGLGVAVAPVVTRSAGPNDFAYLQHVRSMLPGTNWPETRETLG